MQDWNQKEFEERFTEPSKAIERVEHLKALDLSKITDEDLEETINSFFNIIPYPSGTIPAGSELFRARLNRTEVPFDNIADIYAPPTPLIKAYGRANKPGERVFYGASNMQLAAFEVLQDYRYSLYPEREVAFLTIGVWKVKYDLHVASIMDDPSIHELRDDIKKGYEANQKLLFNGKIKDSTAIANNIILQFFSEEFTKHEIRGDFDYRISSFYVSSLREANKFIAPQFESERFDGVNFPSVAMKYKGDNQAIFIDSADSKLEFKTALQVICTNMDFHKGQIALGILHEIENNQGGKFTWKDEVYRP